MREVAARPAHLPDPFVRLVPGAFEELEQVPLQRPRVVVGVEAVHARLVQRVHHLAVHVELELLVRRVADPHRARACVAGQPVELVLGDAPLAADAVEDLRLRRVAGDRAQQPVAPGARLVVKPAFISA